MFEIDPAQETCNSVCPRVSRACVRVAARRGEASRAARRRRGRTRRGGRPVFQEQYCMDKFTPSITNSNKETVPRKILLTVFDAPVLNVLRETFYVL